MAMLAFCGHEGCKKIQSLTGGATLGLSAPVGQAARCRNLAPDVLKVQKALNRFPLLEGGPNPKLKEDSIHGPLTQKAIVAFQKKHFGPAAADGTIDPGKQTDRELCHASATYTALPAEMMTNRARALGIINIARGALTSARHFKEGFPDFTGIGKSNWNKLVLHFQVDRFPGARGWSGAIDFIDSIYVNMQTALGHIPQGLVLLEDEPLDSNVGAYAFTFSGGYALEQRNKTWNGIPMGTIYLCARMQNLDSDAFAYVLIHEGAHYAGPIEGSGNDIDDHAYAHSKNGKYAKLLPWQRTHNADCYAQFAFAASGIPFDLDAHLLVSQ
ncbi:peptidoglycan-binding protein [Variovorax sp. RCC_210]|uniref:peptidoglycan-binding protein n=1 Tax=Variovorax sp. RCC_210 TaxID=3239217 RepID=UPI0035244AFF